MALYVVEVGTELDQIVELDMGQNHAVALRGDYDVSTGLRRSNTVYTWGSNTTVSNRSSEQLGRDTAVTAAGLAAPITETDINGGAYAVENLYALMVDYFGTYPDDRRSKFSDEEKIMLSKLQALAYIRDLPEGTAMSLNSNSAAPAGVGYTNAVGQRGGGLDHAGYKG